tara:strand:- start:375 stop:533 length:159 start_codon:yes stop_codon:yes gene_type:complete
MDRGRTRYGSEFDPQVNNFWLQKYLKQKKENLKLKILIDEYVQRIETLVKKN